MGYGKIIAAMGLAAIMFGSIRARAMILPDYSLIDLIDRGGDIVEGHITAVGQGDQKSAIDFTVDSVVRGKTHVKDALHLDLELFWHGDYRNPKRLAAGDRLIVFLDKRVEPIPAAKVSSPFCNGVILLADHKAYSFHQLHNPGPYEAIDNPLVENRVGPKPMSDKDFRARLGQDLELAASIEKRLENSVSIADETWVFTTLEQLDQETDHRSSMLEAKVAKAFDDLHDFEVLDVACADEKISRRWIFAWGYATAAGRAYLLKGILDPHAAAAARLCKANLIGDAGPCFYSAFDSANRTIQLPQGDNNNAHYLERIASAAIANADRPELFDALVRSSRTLMDRCQPINLNPGEIANAAMVADADRANSALLKFYHSGKADDEELNAIESDLTDADFASLHSRWPQSMGIIRQGPGAGANLPRAVRQLPLDWSGIHDIPTGVDSAQLVIAPLVGNGAAKTVDLGPPGLWPRSITLPATIPSGSYHIFLRYLSKGATVGETHGFVVTLKF